MKKSRKRLIAWMLAAVMALTSGSSVAFANEEAQPVEGEAVNGEAIGVESEQPAVGLGNEGVTAVIKSVYGDSAPAIPGESGDYILEMYDASGKVIDMNTLEASINWDVKLHDKNNKEDETSALEYVSYETDNDILHLEIKKWVEERKIVHITATVSDGAESSITSPPCMIVLLKDVDEFETAGYFAAAGDVISINDLKTQTKRYNKEFPQGKVVDEHDFAFSNDYSVDIKDGYLPLAGAKISSDGKSMTIPKVQDGRYVVCINANSKTASRVFYAPIYVGNGAFKLSTTNYTYNGKVKTPSISVTDADGNTVPSSNYTVSYSSGRKSVGTYKVTVKFKGDLYGGSGAAYFNINPKGTSIYRVSKARKAFTVKWKRQSSKMATSRITGYQVRYSTSSKMTGAKYKTVKGYKYTSKKITKLKAKKKYYVQIRTYKTVSGKNYYSSWSGVKSVTTR